MNNGLDGQPNYLKSVLITRTVKRGLLFVPFAHISTSQARAFSVVGPSVWNGLPFSQRLFPRVLSGTKLFLLDYLAQAVSRSFLMYLT